MTPNLETKKNKENRILILGAPNVGKSSLFNKLIGQRRAIVKDLPGTTRDVLEVNLNLSKLFEFPDYQELLQKSTSDFTEVTLSKKEKLNLECSFMDTGGLFLEDGLFNQEIQRTVEKNIKLASCIWFVTDGRVGITKKDLKISQFLRKINKKPPVITLVNKIDSKDLVYLKEEFYALGIAKEVFSFSCLSRSFSKNLREIIIFLIREKIFLLKQVKNKNKFSDYQTISLIGKPNSGKSSLLNRIINQDKSIVSEIPGTTRDAIDTELNYENNNLLIVDTAGLRRKNKISGDLERYSIDRTIKAIVRSELVLLVIDLTEGITVQDKKLAALIQKRGKSCILILNKWDLVQKTNSTYQETVSQIYQELKFVQYAPIVITSAKTGQRVPEILSKSIEVLEERTKKVSTSLLNKTIREILTISDLPKIKNKTLKIYYVTQTEISPPCFSFFVNHLDLFTDNYQRFLEKKIREDFKFTGTPVKFKVQKSE